MHTLLSLRSKDKNSGKNASQVKLQLKVLETTPTKQITTQQGT
jgi:hypothetical protein